MCACERSYCPYCEDLVEGVPDSTGYYNLESCVFCRQQPIVVEVIDEPEVEYGTETLNIDGKRICRVIEIDEYESPITPKKIYELLQEAYTAGKEGKVMEFKIIKGE